MQHFFVFVKLLLISVYWQCNLVSIGFFCNGNILALGTLLLNNHPSFHNLLKINRKFPLNFPLQCSVKNGSSGNRSSRSQVLLKISQISQGNTCVGAILNKVPGPQVCNFIKKRLQRRCFLLKFAKILRTPFFTEYLW